MAHEVTLIPGDGNGPEIASAIRRILDQAGAKITWDERYIDGQKIPSSVIESLQRTRVGLMGWHASGHRDAKSAPPIVRLRKAFGMFANVRPVKTLKGVPSRHELDLVVVRETTEDIWAHLEHESIPGVYESLKVTTRAACERIAKHAYAYAREHGRKKVTIVHKANIMKKSDGLFLRTAREVAAAYPDITTEDVIVDALCMKLVLTPQKFDVLVAGNLYGDIVADLCTGLAGGASNGPSINVSDDVRVYTSAHGDPTGYEDGNRGNPLTLLLPAIELLRGLGETVAAQRIRVATEKALEEGVVPYSIGGNAGTAQFTNAVCERL